MTKWFLFLGIFSWRLAFADDFVKVCQRESVVRLAIEAKVGRKCSEISAEDLATIVALDLKFGPGEKLGPMDLRSLSGLRWLFISNLEGEVFPAGEFTDLFALEHLNISSNDFTSIADGAFAGLS